MLERLAAAAHLADQRPARRQMFGRLAQDAAHDVEPVRSSGMRERRLGRIFRRKVSDCRRVHIRRVRQDQVEAGAFERREKIALLERNAIPQPVLFEVARGHFQRAWREVDRLDARIREDARGEDRERTAARAEVQRRRDAFRIADERIVLGESRHHQFANQTARDDDALVDIERYALDIGAVDKVGGGLARCHAGFDQFAQPRTLVAQEPGVEKRIEHIDRQAQSLEDEKGGLVERRRCAVTKG